MRQAWYRRTNYAVLAPVGGGGCVPIAVGLVAWLTGPTSR